MQNDLREQTEKAFKFNYDAFGKFRPIDEIKQKAKDTGTGLLTGTLALPSDAVTMAETANTFLADYANNPLAMLIKDNLQNFEKQYGRKAFDEGFEEITGIKSDPENTDQLIGEILSPTGAFLAPAKFFDKLSDGASTLYNTIKNTLSKSDFVKSDLVTEGASLDNTIDVAKQTDDINRPKVDLNVIGEGTEFGKERAAVYRNTEAKMIKEAGEQPTLQSDIDLMKIPAEKASEVASQRNYRMLNQAQKDKLFQETGVYRGSDGKLRTKINPKEATIKLDNLGFARENVQGEPSINEFLDFSKLDNYNLRLRNMLNYEDLYRNYNAPIKNSDGSIRHQPIGNILIKQVEPSETVDATKSKTLASYDPAEDVIYLASGNADDVKRSLIHELQHAIQHREGFESGSSIRGILESNNSRYIERRKSLGNVIKSTDDSFFEKTNLVDEYMKVLTRDMSPSNAKVYIQEQSDPTSRFIMSTFAKEKFDSMVKKLADREYQQVKSLGPQSIYLKVDRFGGTADANFTEIEEALANSLASNKSFKEYMKLRTMFIRPEEKTLDSLYDIAQQAYLNKGGEVEARYAEQLVDFENTLPDPSMYYKIEDN